VIQSSPAPTTKTLAAGIAGAVTMIVVWAVKTWGKVDIPPEIAVAISTVISFAASYLTPPRESDILIRGPE